jgi:hypothetical protein
MSDLNFQDISTVAGPLSPKPVTIASAATVAPSTFLTYISGTVAIATVTPPVTGAHMLCFVFTTTTPTAFTTTGNIKAVATPATNLPVFLLYNPNDGKYYAGMAKAS